MPRYVLVDVNEGRADFDQCNSLEELSKQLRSRWSNQAQRYIDNNGHYRVELDCHQIILDEVAKLQVGQYGSYPGGMVFRVSEYSLEQSLFDFEEEVKRAAKS